MFISLEYQEEDEVPDDETLNQMIARNEEEFELFMVRITQWSLPFLKYTPSLDYPQLKCL